MGNLVSRSTYIGTIGELLVQLRLFEYGVQAAPPIKDSGNDLIAIRGEVIKFIQVKTKDRSKSYSRKMPKIYHLVIYVDIKRGEKDKIMFDKSEVWVRGKSESIRQKRELNKILVDEIWGN